MNVTNSSSIFTMRWLDLPSLDIEAWRELSSESERWNPFYEDWNVLPAVNILDVPAPVVLCCYINTLLVGIFFFTKTKFGYKSWTHKYCFSQYPILRKGYETRILASLSTRIHWPIVIGPIFSDLPLANAPNRVQFEQSSRAFFTNEIANRTTFLADSIGNKRVKELQKKWNKADAELEVETSPELIDTFLKLEDSQWKGKLGTSHRANQADELFFREICNRGSGKVQLARLQTESSTIAMLCFFESNGSIFSYKCAFDETQAAVSPGLLLEYQLLINRLCPSAPKFDVDSCAIANSPLFARIWGSASERAVCKVMFFPDNWPIVFMRRAYNFARRQKRKLFSSRNFGKSNKTS